MGARANDKRKTAKRGEKGTSARPETGGHKGSSLLFMVGIGAILFGLCLAILPPYVPQADWYSVVLARVGVTSSPVVLGGLVLLLISFMTRVLGIVAGTGGAGATRASDELHGDIGELQDVIRKIHVEVLQLKSSQASTMEAVGEMRSETRDNPQVNGSGLDEEIKNALFRVAASVDQMGARIDGLMTKRYGELKATLEDLRAGIFANRTELETSLRAFEERLPGALAGQSAPTTHHETPPAPSMPAEPVLAAGTDSGADTGSIALGTSGPNTAEPLTDLGVLDEIEDFASRELPEMGQLDGLDAGPIPSSPQQPEQPPAQNPVQDPQNAGQSFDW